MADDAGTRGLVTTLEESTGSVGESSAPTRKDCVQSRSVRAWVASATMAAVIGIASTSLRSGRRHAAGASRRRPRARRGRGSRRARRWPARRRSPTSASKSSTSRPPSPSTKPASTNSAVSDRKRAARQPRQQGADDQQRAEHEQRRVEACTRHSSRRRRGGYGAARADHRAGQVAVMAGRRTAPAAAISWRTGDTSLLLDCGNGVFGKLRRFRDYIDVDAVVISHLHADHFLDLVPYSLRADLRAAPAARPRRTGGRAPTTRPARGCRPAGATSCSAAIVGAWGSEDLIENAFDLQRVRRRRTSVEVGPLRLRFQAVAALHATHAVEISSTQRRRALHLRRRHARPTTSSWPSPATPTC